MIAQTKKVGDIELTALSDGRLATSLDVILGMDRAEAARLAGMTGDNLHIAVNAFLLKLAGKWALIDVGAGDSMGPELGRLAENLRTFGVAPEEIAAVFLTHIHPDHSNGLVDASGQAVYPNAELILHETEARFWLDRDEASGENERIRRNIAKAAVATAPYRHRMRTVREGEAMAGVAAVALPGHTPGHTGWMIASGKESLLIWGDLVHLASVQVARPDTRPRVRCRPASGVRHAVAHVRPRRRRQTQGRRRPHGFSRLRNDRAQGRGLCLRAGGVSRRTTRKGRRAWRNCHAA
jgi:glyoxylase-like metal-dependent hydrolase (beta-lactamase superfamily II)